MLAIKVTHELTTSFTHDLTSAALGADLVGNPTLFAEVLDAVAEAMPKIAAEDQARQVAGQLGESGRAFMQLLAKAIGEAS